MTKKSIGRQKKDALAELAKNQAVDKAALVETNPILKMAHQELNKLAQAEVSNKATAQTDRCWDEASDMYRQCKSVFGKYAEMGRAMNDEATLQYVADRRTFISRVALLKSDLGRLGQELEQIYAMHAGRTGGRRNDREMIAALEVFELYQAWIVRHAGVIDPTANEISSIIHVACQARAAAERDAAAADPKVVTDVQFTEAPLTDGQVLQNAFEG